MQTAYATGRRLTIKELQRCVEIIILCQLLLILEVSGETSTATPISIFSDGSFEITPNYFPYYASTSYTSGWNYVTADLTGFFPKPIKRNPIERLKIALVNKQNTYQCIPSPASYSNKVIRIQFNYISANTISEPAGATAIKVSLVYASAPTTSPPAQVITDTVAAGEFKILDSDLLTSWKQFDTTVLTSSLTNPSSSYFCILFSGDMEAIYVDNFMITEDSTTKVSTKIFYDGNFELTSTANDYKSPPLLQAVWYNNFKASYPLYTPIVEGVQMNVALHTFQCVTKEFFYGRTMRLQFLFEWQFVDAICKLMVNAVTSSDGTTTLLTSLDLVSNTGQWSQFDTYIKSTETNGDLFCFQWECPPKAVGLFLDNVILSAESCEKECESEDPCISSSCFEDNCVTSPVCYDAKECTDDVCSEGVCSYPVNCADKSSSCLTSACSDKDGTCSYTYTCGTTKEFCKTMVCNEGTCEIQDSILNRTPLF